jgi:hypothetical protein
MGVHGQLPAYLAGDARVVGNGRNVGGAPALELRAGCPQRIFFPWSPGIDKLPVRGRPFEIEFERSPP